MGRGDDLLDNIETGPPPEKLVKNWPCDFLTFVPLLDTADLRVREPGKNSLLLHKAFWVGFLFKSDGKKSATVGTATQASSTRGSIQSILH